jgi:hypothetical protein
MRMHTKLMEAPVAEMKRLALLLMISWKVRQSNQDP